MIGAVIFVGYGISQVDNSLQKNAQEIELLKGCLEVKGTDLAFCTKFLGGMK